MNVNFEANFGIKLAMNKLHVAILSHIEAQNNQQSSLDIPTYKFMGSLSHSLPSRRNLYNIQHNSENNDMYTNLMGDIT